MIPTWNVATLSPRLQLTPTKLSWLGKRVRESNMTRHAASGYMQMSILQQDQGPAKGPSSLAIITGQFQVTTINVLTAENILVR